MDDALNKAKGYSRAKHYLAIWEILIYICFFAILTYSGFSSYLSAASSVLSKNFYIALLLYLFFLGILLNITVFPIRYLSSFKTEHTFGLSRQTFLSWFKDYIKASVISGAIFIAMVVILYLFLKLSNNLWWLYTALIYSIFNILLAKIFPIIIIPLFYKLSRISDTPLRERLLTLAQRGGVNILDIYNIALGKKTNKANAALCGLGATKRILLSDTLLQKYTPEEIEATLAHELAHYKHSHFWKLSFYNLIFTLSAFVIINILLQQAVETGIIKHIYDVSFFPALVLFFTFYNIILTPLSNFISRRYETEADRETVSLTKNQTAFISLIKKLTLQNLSDPQPSFLTKLFFYDHPPAEERISKVSNAAG